MKKAIVKKILCILDMVEIQEIDKNKAVEKILCSKENEHEEISSQEAFEVMDFCIRMHLIRDTHSGFDLTPCATVFAKADSYSVVEALALLECLLPNPLLLANFMSLIQENPYLHKIDVYERINDEMSYQMMIQTCFYEVKDYNFYRINPLLLIDVSNILKEYQEIKPLISSTLLAMFTAQLIHHDDISIQYRNADLDMIPYEQTQIILDILPRRGIPNDREETRSLQSFYKDTLFHEFDHRCPICGIDLPHMLIASHIKPFRSCAHIFECIDNNNGLLLCRNHDYLFDQGYISFDDDGSLMISDELTTRQTLDAYHVHTNIKLDARYLTDSRRKFLAYHRSHTFLHK